MGSKAHLPGEWAEAGSHAVELGGKAHDLNFLVPPPSTETHAPPPLPGQQSRPLSVPAARRLPPGPVHAPPHLLCARSHPSSIPFAHLLPPGSGINFLAPGKHDAKYAAGPTLTAVATAATAATAAMVTAEMVAMAAAAAAMMTATVAAMTVTVTAVTVVAVAVVTMVAAVAMTTAVASMTTAVIAAYTTTLGPRGSQTPSETMATVAAVAGNTPPAPQVVASQTTFSCAPRLIRGYETYNNLRSGIFISLVHGCCRCSSRSTVAPWAGTSTLSPRGGNLASRTGAAAQTALCRITSGTTKA